MDKVNTRQANKTDKKRKFNLKLFSLIIGIVIALSTILGVGLVFINKGNRNLAPDQVETEKRYKGTLIGGIYYAAPEEVTGAVDAFRDNKGAIYVDDGAEVTINSGNISGHEALYGGAIYVAAGGVLNINGGNIYGNTSRLGGAVYVEAGGTVDFTGGNIYGNSSEIIPTGV